MWGQAGQDIVINGLFFINLPCIQQLITFIRWIYVEYTIKMNFCLEFLTVWKSCYVQCNTLTAVYSSRCVQNRMCWREIWKLLCVMLSNVQWKCKGCHLYGMNKKKVRELGRDMELPAVMLYKLLCRYEDSICSVWYFPMLSIFGISFFNNSHVTHL